MPSLDEEIALLHSGDHLCLPYADAEEQLEPLTSFARHGITRGERFVYIGPRPKLDAMLQRLDGLGIDTRRALDRRAIAHVESTGFYRPDGSFDAQRSLDAVDELIATAQRAGFAGLRGATDITSLEADESLTEAIVEYETRLTKVMRRQPVVAMCQFDRRGVRPALLRRLLCAHPKALAGGHVCANPYYEPAAVLDEPDREAMRLEWMLRQLDRAHREDERHSAYAQTLAARAASLILEVGQRRRSEDELARVLQNRDAFMSLASETLAGAARAVRADVSGLLTHDPVRAGRALGHVALLETIADQMHEVVRVPGRRGLNATECDLAETVRECTARHTDDRADARASLHVTADERIPGRWDRARVEQLLDALLSRAIRCARCLPVWVTAQPDGPDRARIVVRIEHSDDAAPVPERASQSHQQAFETTVWLPRTLAESMNGALLVTGSPLTGEEILVELPSAPVPTSS